MERGITESGIMESGITGKQESGITGKQESGITETGITESGITESGITGKTGIGYNVQIRCPRPYACNW